MTDNLITGSHELAQAGLSTALHICAASEVTCDLFSFALYILQLDSFNGLKPISQLLDTHSQKLSSSVFLVFPAHGWQLPHAF